MKRMYTAAELEAYLYVNNGNHSSTMTKDDEIVKAADKILELAERIKSQRMVQIRQIGIDNSESN